CINLIVKISTNPEDLIGVISERNAFNFPLLHLNYQMNVQRASSLSQRLFNFYVFDNLNDSQIENIVDQMIQLPWFYPSAKFLFTGTNFSSEMLKHIAKYYIINVTFVDIFSGIITTSYPYKNNNLHNIDTDSSVIGSCDGNLLSLNVENLFPKKIPKKWMKSYIRLEYNPVSIFAECFTCKTRYQGIEIEIFILIFDYLKVRIEAAPTTSSNAEDDFVQKSDVRFGLETIAFWNTQMDITWPYLHEPIKWFIAPASEIPRWKYIFTIFHKNVWIILIITVLAVSTTWTFGQYFNDGRLSAKLFCEITSSPFVLFLEQSREFSSESLFHKILVLCIIFMSTITNFLFGTRLAYLLNGKNYEMKIENLEQLREHNFYIGYYSELIKVWSNQTLELHDYPEYFYVNCRQIMLTCIQRSIEDRDIALVGSEKTIRKWAMKYSSTRSLKSLNVQLQTAAVHAFLRKGHPIFPLINRMLQNLVESGIVKNISEKYNKLLWINNVHLLSRRLNLQHLVFPLSIWTIGNFLSIIVFYYEKTKSNNIGI
ncbi:hypothetical protein HHI36_007087, partial [Cryptolaemus montrouzieri]